MRRKSKSFWKILSEHAIPSTIIRVPITFPPEKFDGDLLSAMCTPDLRGTQGSFSQLTTRLERPTYESGSRYPLARHGQELTGSLEGPENEFVDGAGALALPFRISAISCDAATVHIGSEAHRLTRGEHLPAIQLACPAAPPALRG